MNSNKTLPPTKGFNLQMHFRLASTPQEATTTEEPHPSKTVMVSRAAGLATAASTNISLFRMPLKNKKLKKTKQAKITMVSLLFMAKRFNSLAEACIMSNKEKPQWT
jgi:hypothetical protein